MTSNFTRTKSKPRYRFESDNCGNTIKIDLEEEQREKEITNFWHARNFIDSRTSGSAVIDSKKRSEYGLPIASDMQQAAAQEIDNLKLGGWNVVEWMYEAEEELVWTPTESYKQEFSEWKKQQGIDEASIQERVSKQNMQRMRAKDMRELEEIVADAQKKQSLSHAVEEVEEMIWDAKMMMFEKEFCAPREAVFNLVDIDFDDECDIETEVG